MDNNQITEILPCNIFISNIYQVSRISLRNNICVDRLLASYDGSWIVYDLDEYVHQHLNRCYSLYYLFLDSQN